MSMTIIYMVRHGETLFNIVNRVQGWCDSPLTKTGWQQAKVLGEGLSNISFDCAYASTSERAIDTLRAILQDKSVPCHFDKRFKEFNFGMMEGKHGEEVFIGDNHYPDGFFEVGGESKGQCLTRFFEGLEDIVRQCPDGNVLLVTHGGIIKEVLSVLMPEKEWKEPARILVPNCSVSKLVYKDGTYSVEECCSMKYMKKGYGE